MLSKEQIQTVVKKYVIETLAEVTEFQEADYRTTASLEDLGASSLDVVEIVSRSTRDLKLKVPPAKLAGIKSIDELIETLYQVASATSTSGG